MPALGVAFAAGALTTLSPCVLPLLPLIGSGALARHRLGPLALVTGLVSSFALVGGALVAAGSLFGLSQEAIRGGALLVLLAAGGFLLVPRAGDWLGERLAGVASAVASSTRRFDGGGLGGQFLIGATLGLVWSPCAGPTLGSIVGLAARDGLGPATVLMLSVFGVGAAAPLLVFAYGARRALRSRALLQRTVGLAKPMLGAVLILLAVLGLSGLDKKVEAFLLDHTPPFLTNLSVML